MPAHGRTAAGVYFDFEKATPQTGQGTAVNPETFRVNKNKAPDETAHLRGTSLTCIIHGLRSHLFPRRLYASAIIEFMRRPLARTAH
ncbi:hypothetical protein EVAR_6533_1 [Eumeta japonica]|uniref:Uncharacterized protein n=1 Tax=Eumeta variegata TaxID=151549 RepID=A0A4C1SQA1_EUMVA|nr:hypothetical protein EVAR_6533_1 [Eumeta japonica]